MLFNSYVYILFFLPTVFLVFAVMSRRSSPGLLVAWLTFSSMFFYGWWNPRYLLFIGFSVIINYAIGRNISSSNLAGSKKLFLILGISLNLGFLGYFKYAAFLVENLNGLGGFDFIVGDIVLPLAISFFTFQQIAYLVDTYKGEVEEHNFVRYSLFVTFFPQLIAGPIVHHKEMLPQFFSNLKGGIQLENVSVGCIIFFIGLAKKVIVADQLARYANPIFDEGAIGGQVDFYAAWLATFSYSFQIYFDFSGYSDMAVGAARLFGIRLPLNFFSPYKATSPIDFWRRWHVSLSRFLRDYLYIPLGGNRRGQTRQYVNLMATMVLGGLWHGAGWTFVIWGTLHGTYLVANHLWNDCKRRLGLIVVEPGRLQAYAARAGTFLLVSIAWVFFRSANLPSALAMLRAMAGINGLSMPRDLVNSKVLHNLGIAAGSQSIKPFLGNGVTLMIVWLLPNTYEFTRDYAPVMMPPNQNLESAWKILTWKPNIGWALILDILILGSFYAMLSESVEFLYYNF